jgi:hypothetical protein
MGDGRGCTKLNIGSAQEGTEMTKRNATGILVTLLLSTLTAAAQSKPKVCFHWRSIYLQLE